MSLHGKALFITGASRGTSREIALRAVRDGTNLVIAAKDVEPHPRLEGTIFGIAAEVEVAGNQALSLQLDVRDEQAVAAAMARAAERFGGIDALVNNAGAICLVGVKKLEPKRFDLMYQINTRVVLICSQAALPYLRRSANGHILSLLPPINLAGRWFAQHSPYTVIKYDMGMLTLGMHEEFGKYAISVNALWPKTMIATAAIESELGSRDAFRCAHTPAAMADAAHAILTSEGRSFSGRLLVDEELLCERGQSSFEQYRYDLEGGAPVPDLFLDWGLRRKAHGALRRASGLFAEVPRGDRVTIIAEAVAAV